MPTYREQIEATVNEMVKAGRIQEGMRAQYVDLLAKDEAVAQEFAGRFMRHDDYTRKTQEVARQRQEQEARIRAEEARVAQERQALQQWEAEAKAEMARLRGLADQYPELHAKVAAYEQALADFNMTEHVKIPTVGGGQPAVTTPNPYAPPTATQPAQTQGNYLTREDVGAFAQQMLELNAKTLQIAGQHQRLFGQPLEDNIIMEAMSAGQDPQAYWESKYNVPGKRAEIQAREREAEIARIREEERAKIVAEYATDPSRLMGGQFAMDTNQVPTSKAFDTISSRGLAPESAPAPELAHPQLAKQQRVERAAATWDRLFDAGGNPRQAGGPTGSF